MIRSKNISVSWALRLVVLGCLLAAGCAVTVDPGRPMQHWHSSQADSDTCALPGECHSHLRCGGCP